MTSAKQFRHICHETVCLTLLHYYEPFYIPNMQSNAIKYLNIMPVEYFPKTDTIQSKIIP